MAGDPCSPPANSSLPCLPSLRPRPPSLSLSLVWRDACGWSRVLVTPGADQPSPQRRSVSSQPPLFEASRRTRCEERSRRLSPPPRAGPLTDREQRAVPRSARYHDAPTKNTLPRASLFLSGGLPCDCAHAVRGRLSPAAPAI